MAKVLVIDGKVCADAGTVRLDCGCGPSSACCETDANGNTLTLHIPEGVTPQVYLSGSIIGGYSAPGTSISVIAQFNRLPLIVPTAPTTACDSGWNASLFVQSSDSDPAITVGGAYSDPNDSGGLTAWSIEVIASRTFGVWNGSSPPDSITTGLDIFVRVSAEYSLGGGSSEFRDWETTLRVAGNPCDPLEVNPCEQIFSVSPLGLFADCNNGGVQVVSATPGPGSIASMNGFDSGRWDIAADFLEVQPVTGGNASISGNVDLRTEFEWVEPTDPPVLRTRWLTCPNYAEAVGQCQAQGTTCCGSGDCGKQSASFPFQWRRVADAVTRLADRTTAGAAIVSYLSNAQDVNSTVNAQASECVLNETTAIVSGGGVALADQFGIPRILSMSGATIGDVTYGARIRLTPDPAPGLGKRFTFEATLPVLWTRSGQTPHPIGVLVIVGTTVDSATVSTLLTISTAEFRWNTTQPAANSLGVQFDPGETRPAVVALNNGTEFDLVATPTGPGCYRQFQLIPRVAPADPGGPFVVKTDRTLRLVDGVNVTPYRNLLLSIDLEAFVQLINIAACPQSGAVSASSNCVSCGGPIVNGVCQVCGQRSARPCVGCGN